MKRRGHNNRHTFSLIPTMPLKDIERPYYGVQKESRGIHFENIDLDAMVIQEATRMVKRGECAYTELNGLLAIQVARRLRAEYETTTPKRTRKLQADQADQV